MSLWLSGQERLSSCKSCRNCFSLSYQSFCCHSNLAQSSMTRSPSPQRLKFASNTLHGPWSLESISVLHNVCVIDSPDNGPICTSSSVGAGETSAITTNLDGIAVGVFARLPLNVRGELREKRGQGPLGAGARRACDRERVCQASGCELVTSRRQSTLVQLGTDLPCPPPLFERRPSHGHAGLFTSSPLSMVTSV